MTGKTKTVNMYELTDEIIDVINDHAEASNLDEMNKGAVYAAARYSAHIITLCADDAKEVAEIKEERLDFYCDKFREMLSANIDEFAKFL